MELQKSVQTLESLAVNVTFSKEPMHFISYMPCRFSMWHYKQHTNNMKMVWKEWDFFRLTEPHWDDVYITLTAGELDRQLYSETDKISVSQQLHTDPTKGVFSKCYVSCTAI